MNINNLLNKKLVNVIIKKIKRKIMNFYNKRELLSLSEIKNIEVNKPFDNLNKFIVFMNKIPFKYFIIDIKNKTVDYAYPIVKVAITELLETNEINTYIPTNEGEKGWNFEKKSDK